MQDDLIQSQPHVKLSVQLYNCSESAVPMCIFCFLIHLNSILPWRAFRSIFKLPDGLCIYMPFVIYNVSKRERERKKAALGFTGDIVLFSS